jgi:hypothetical protein
MNTAKYFVSIFQENSSLFWQNLRKIWRSNGTFVLLYKFKEMRRRGKEINITIEIVTSFIVFIFVFTYLLWLERIFSINVNSGAMTLSVYF